MTSEPGGPRHVSDILTDITQADELPRSVREAIAKGVDHQPHRACPCERCMRAYLRGVEGKAG